MRVRGEGPIPCDIVLVGEAPGEQEDLTGRPFVGRSGDELNRYLSSADLRRREVFITNLVKERPLHNADPAAWMIERDAPELMTELKMHEPAWIITIGRISTRWFLGDVDMEDVHGLVFDVGGPWGRSKLIPTYHPAAGMHSPDTQTMIQYDWRRVRAYLSGAIAPTQRADQHPNPKYTLLEPHGVFDSRIAFSPTPEVVAIDTEGLPGRPWGLSFSVRPGEAYVIKADNRSELTMFAKLLKIHRPVIALHNAPHDIPVLRELGVEIPYELVFDQMIGAYLLCVEPQGLKPLAYRHASMKMRSYVEVTADADRRVAIEYLQKVMSHRACGECKGTGLCVTIRPKIVETCAKCFGVGQTMRVYKTKPAVVTECKKCKGVGTKTTPAAVRESKCETCAGDGTTWPTPEQQLEWDPKKRAWKVYQPTSIGRTVRKILDDVAAGKTNTKGELTDPRARWNDKPEEVLEVVAEELGEMPEATLDDVDPSDAVNYSARDADATIRTFPIIRDSIDAMDLGPVLAMDHAILPMIVRMQDVGMQIEPEYFHGLTDKWTKEMRQIQSDIQRLVGVRINPSSPKQVAALLFDQLGMPSVKLNKTKTAESTDDKVLEALKVKTHHPVIDLLTGYRELHKLVGTYTRPLPRKADAQNRIHTKLRVTRTASGRLSSFDPNLQNIPTRSANGKLIRGGFVARPGHMLASWDLDQIEMRILAHESSDPKLVEIFNTAPNCPVAAAHPKHKCTCHDIHLYTASKVFRVPVEQVTDDQRTSAKNIGFGIVYGITAKGLKFQMELRGIEVTEDDCQAMIDAYLVDAFPGVAVFMEEATAEARRKGYVSDMFGRVRYLPAVHSTVPWVRAEAERQAGNHKIQAGAQGAIKIAMATVWNKILPSLWRQKLQVECLMQIHDELIFEFEEGKGIEEMLDVMVVAAMRDAVELRVPIGAKGNWGRRWSDLK